MLGADRTSDRAEVPPSLFEPTPERSMQPLSVTGSQQVSHTASLVREVLTRLTAFKLPPTPENFAWVYRQVQREQNLAMRLNTHLIRNLDSLQGKHDLVVSAKGQNVILQFALFAVPPRR